MRHLYDKESSLDQAAAFLKAGEIVAFPTETVYGLGADLFCDGAIEKLYQAKKRDHSKPFTAHISNLMQVYEIAIDLPDEFFQIAKIFFPGPLTIVLKKHPRISSLVTSSLDTIGIRMPAHDTALKLIKKAGFPLAATSANISGQSCITDKEQLIREFGNIAAFVDGGALPCGVASTVISLVDPKNPLVLRQGSLLLSEIVSLIKKK